jgi:hypothetical protein
MSIPRINLIVLILAVCSVFSSYGQGVLKIGDDLEVAGDTNLLIDAQVLEDGKPMANINVLVIYKGLVIREAETEKNGFFQFKIGFDTLVTLNFSQDGYLTKLIEIDTRNMPEEDRFRGYDAGLFKLSMIKSNDEIPIALYKKPIAKFIYDPAAVNFIMDRKYKKEVKNNFKKADVKPDIIKF